MIQEKMVRARRQYHHHHPHTHQHHHHNHYSQQPQQHNASSNSSQQQQDHHRHALSHSHRSNKRSHVPNAPSNTTQFIMNDHELIEPDFDLMHNAIMEHYNKSKRRKLQNQISDESSTNHTSSINPDRVAAKSATDCVGVMEKSPRKVASTDQDEAFGQAPRATFIEKSATAAPIDVELTTNTTNTTTNTNTSTTSSKSPLRDLDDEETKNQQRPLHKQQQQTHVMQQHGKQTTTTTTTATTTTSVGVNEATLPAPASNAQLHESTNQSNPTTPNYRPMTGSPGDEDGLSPFINHEHLQSEFQEVYANIHTERLSSMSKNQLVDKYLLLEERVEELENQLRESQTASAVTHG